jgi:hypothetical protein
MTRLPLLLAVALAMGGMLSPLAAQKDPPPAVRPQGQQPAARPQTQPASGANPATAGKVFRPATPGTQPAPTAPAAGTGAAPATQPGPVVTPQASQPSAAPAVAAPATVASTFTAGLAMPPLAGGTPDAALTYAARLGRMLDSTVVTLVDVFRNTSGQPMSGASSPAALSQRERDRWVHCRNLYWDFTTYATAVGTLKQTLPAAPALQHAVAALDTAFSATAAIGECDNVASMIASPERWTPWQEQYEAAARHFYRDFYTQIREVHERDRAFVNALNATLTPERRIPVPAGLPRNPPYAGAAPS